MKLKDSIEWISSEGMKERYNISQSSLDIFAHSRGKEYVRKEGRSVYYNAKLLEKILNDKKEKWLKNHDMYYKLMKIFISESSIAQDMESKGYGSAKAWRNYLNTKLFRLMSDNILTIGKKHTQHSRFYDYAIKKLNGGFVIWDEAKLQIVFRKVRRETNQMLKIEARKIRS